MQSCRALAGERSCCTAVRDIITAVHHQVQSITAVHHQVQSRLGLSIVVRDNETTNYAAIRAQLGRWLARDYGIEHIVPGYSEVPRRLLVETLLIHQGGFPSEHKFFMFNGVARLVLLRANYGDRGHEPSSGPEARQQNKGKLGRTVSPSKLEDASTQASSRDQQPLFYYFWEQVISCRISSYSK